MTIFDTEFDRDLMNCINDNAKGYSKQCARNAIHHLEKAWEIKDIDKEMAIFRAITAEEEAATAVFIALKEKGYENSNKIKFKKHPYKQALDPFIRSIGDFSEKMVSMPGFPFGEKYILKIEGEGKYKKLSLSFYFHKGTVTAIPPLGFEVSKNGKTYHFEEELLEITQGQNRADIIKHVNSIANLRNELLYAQPDGIPSISSDIQAHLDRRKAVVIVFLRIYALIYPYKEKAIFIQQALNAYLKMMGEIEGEFEQ